MRTLEIALALALCSAALATPPPAELAVQARARATEVFVALVACEQYRAQLCAIRDRTDARAVPEAFRAALPELIAARDRELALVRAVADGLRDPRWDQIGAAVFERADERARAWLAAVLEQGPTVLFDGWQNEGAMRGRTVGGPVDDLVTALAERIKPRARPPLMPVLLALAAGAAGLGGAAALRRRLAAPAPPALPSWTGAEATLPRAAALDDGAGDGIPSRVRDALAERYVGLTMLGAGGMGLVLRARDRVLQRDVAIKLPHAQVRAQSDVLARFLREAQALAKLAHPAIVRVLDVHATDPVYYTMELVEGGTLHDRMEARAHWTAADALAVMAPVASALAACHRAGLVHRDVKPANILIDGAGAVRLSDFGLAFLETGTRLTLTDQIVGTPGFLAPEVIEGGRPTPACDVHAWGLVLYDLLSGDPDARGRKLGARLTEDPAPLARFRADLDAGLGALVAACVARDPDARPADGAALVERLEALAARPDPQAGYARAANALEAQVAADLHTLKNTAERTGQLGDRAALATVSAALAQVAAEPAVPPALAAQARALAAELGHAAPPALADLHRRASALVGELALPLRPALDEVVRRYGRRARLSVDLPPPSVFVADRAAALKDLQLCVANWIDNALGADASRVDVILGGSERAAIVRVTNDGEPFPAGARASAFREPITAQGEGRGTGLITVARTARARGWTVHLEDGEPTTFRLTIPV